jgi:eukaryotic-like serine/threonine-protein kinase
LVCPHCGTSAAALGGTCARCGKRVPAGSVAAATLTPFPPSEALSETTPGSISDEMRLTSSDGETRLASGPEANARAAVCLGALAPGDVFGPRYRILRVLGAGGMGIVYHAWDEELAVAVALKVIRPEVSADPVTAKELEKRFKRELLLARQVTHHNVVRIHDIGEVAGTKYITMTFLDGRDLANVLKTAGHLPVGEVLPLVRQLAAGLQSAHQAGVIHRDLKPANIMVEGDALVIMDFGIARSAVQPLEGNVMHGTMPLSRSALVTGATMQGAIVGTVAYMSPEQAKGQPADQRSDIYAVGMIMRDMLVGLRPTEKPTDAMDELMARVDRAPTPVREIDPAIPDDVDRIVTRCLQPDAGARYQSVEELLADLNGLDSQGHPLPKVRPLTKRIVGGAALLMLALLGGTWWLARPSVVPVQPAAMSVLVADFQNLANDPVFEGSLEQTLATAMEGASFITAYPRANAQRLAAQMKPGSALDASMARLVSRREGIKIILAGAIEQTSSGYRLSVRALDPALDSDYAEPLATVTVTARSKAEVLGVLGSMAAEIRGELGDTRPESERLAAAETFTAASLDAVKAYARGQELTRSGKPREALTALEEAVRLDPGFAAAYVQIASIFTNLKMEDRAKANYGQALKHLDRMTEREKYRMLGVYYFGVVRNYEEAIKNYETLVRLYPADNTGYANLALNLLYVGNVARAVEMGRKATEIYPGDILQRTNYATYSMYAGDFKTAVAEAQRVLKANPKYEWANLTLALSTLALGDEQGGREAYARLAAASPLGASLARLGEADLEMYYGRTRAALDILRAGIPVDEKEQASTQLALKLLASAEAQLTLGQRTAAAGAAARAAALEAHESVLFPAARVLIAAGQPEKARAIAEKMDGVIQSRTRAYGRLVAGAIALQRKRYPDAIDAVRAGLKLHDSWVGHALLGEAYFAAGHAAEALAEWEACLKRRGEATDAFFADTSTLRSLPPMHYWLGRAQQALGATPAARVSYAQFLALRTTADPPDPLVLDARRRLAGL